MLLKLLVLDHASEYRGRLADVLCELPGVEVVGSASDLQHGIRMLVETRPDLIAATTAHPADVVALLAVAREMKITDVVIHAPDAYDDASDGWLASGASHVVTGDLDAVARSVLHIARERSSLTERVSAVAARMIKSARIINEPTETVDLADVLKQTIAAYRRLIPDDIDVIVESATGTRPVRCVPKQIERLALRIVEAACAGMPWGGRIWLIVEPQDGDHVRIEVLDSGSGVRAVTPGAGVRIAPARREPAERERMSEIRSIVETQRGSLRIGRTEDGRDNMEIVFPAV